MRAWPAAHQVTPTSTERNGQRTLPQNIDDGGGKQVPQIEDDKGKERKLAITKMVSLWSHKAWQTMWNVNPPPDKNDTAARSRE